MTSILKRTAAFTAHEKPVAGDMKTSFVGYDHLGWMKCDGRSLSVAQNNLLFQVIGYQFGGSGDSFNLPNPAGGVVGIVGQRTGTSLYGPGADVGEEEHKLSVAEMPSHTHSGTTDSSGTHTHTQTTVNDDFNNSSTYPNFSKPSYPNYDSTGSVTWTSTINASGAHTHTFTTGSTGGDQPHNTIQPTLFMGNMFIYSGVPTYPGFPIGPGYAVNSASAWPGTSGLNPPLI